jgi:GNAT superfamily N-acetyltransferase
MEKYTTLAASQEDVRELVRLVNIAYRGGSEAGWTSEGQYLDGSRTDEASIAALVQAPGSVLLKCLDGAGRLVGCVHLEKEEGHLHLGTFAVSPEIQAQGLGRLLLERAEDYARENGCDRIVITVVSARTELIAWYERRGYVPTGKRIPFPAKWGTPKFAVDFVEMEKVLVRDGVIRRIK